ncbi:hypothetical protein [Paenibacillus sp. CAA11]|uniref:hypothetical protein n=1 Tax=Paenibacillus sp. CAA11 TaxID=1532905 RepID=UPI0019005C71|nr:hypothetical protein [Paenibacillus sp. CAA11]
MNKQEQRFTKITVTVNGERVGNELLIDKETYLPVARQYVNKIETPVNVEPEISAV